MGEISFRAYKKLKNRNMEKVTVKGKEAFVDTEKRVVYSNPDKTGGTCFHCLSHNELYEIYEQVEF